MKTEIQTYCGLLFLGFCFYPAAVQGAAPDSCWRKVGLANNTEIQLIRVGDKSGTIRFNNNIEVAIQVKSPPALTDGELTTTATLSVNSGQVRVGSGEFQLSHGDGRYAVPDSVTVRHDLHLSALKGTRLQLLKPVDDDILPAGTDADVVIGQEGVRAQLSAGVNLAPIAPEITRARLDPGALPISRGGRTLQTNLYVPGLDRGELEKEAFQACFYTNDVDNNSIATLAHLISAEDSHVVLDVPVPRQHNSILYNSVQLQILAPTLGVVSNERVVHIGNPFVAFILSIVFVLLVLFFIAKKLSTPNKGFVNKGFVMKILSFAVGVHGRVSLSLFQIYIWTLLVLTGMAYVFLMSGDLLNVSQQVLILLGLSGVGSIGARWIAVGAVSDVVGRGARFFDMLLVEGRPDLHRLQLFLFTIAIWFYVAVRVFYEQAFPELTTNVLLLMGISNGVYMGGKWAVQGDPAALKRQQENLTLEISMLEEKVNEYTDPVTNTAIVGKEKELEEASSALSAKKKDLLLVTSAIES